MNVFAIKKNFLPKLFLRISLLLPFILFLFCFTIGCTRKLNYFDYVSELRSNIFLAETEDFSLRVYAVKKEVPYTADGIPRESSSRFEAYLVCPNGNETTNLSFRIGERAFGGEMSFDNVRGEYFYSCSLDVSTLSEIDCTVVYGKNTYTMTAKSVLNAQTLSPHAALEKLIAENNELFGGMTDEYGFSGEIYLRLLYEDSPYYYIGVIDRTGKVNAFLMNAESGKILAKRQSN